MKTADEIKSKLVDWIAASIQDQGLTQQTVGERVHLPQGRVSQLVNGKIDLFSIDNLVNIASKLGMDVTLKVTQRPIERTYTGKPIKQ